MSVFLKTLEKDLEARRSFISAVKAAGRVGSDPFTGKISNVLGGLGNQDLALASEQLSHNRGYVYALIRLIHNRISGQELRVARVISKKENQRVMQFGPRCQGERLCKQYIEKYVPKNFHRRLNSAEVLDEHPIIDLFANPNPVMISPIIWQMLVDSMETTGRGFLWFRPAEETLSGDIEIWPWPSSWVEAIHGSNKLFESWKVHSPTGDEPLIIPGGQMAFFYYPDPSSPIGALSPLQALANSVLADEYVEIAQRTSFKHGPNPALALTIGRMPGMTGDSDPSKRPTLTKEQRYSILNMIKSQYSGVLNHGMPLLLDGFIQDVKRIDASPREMDYMTSGQSTKGRLAQGWGVNLISMGEMESANRACHDDATELLTRRGWLKYDEINGGDEAGTVNQKTGQLEWQQVQKIHIYPDYKGEMVRLSGLKVDAMVTPDHRMWKTRHIQIDGPDGSRPLTRSIPWSFAPASDLKCHDTMLLSPNRAAFDMPGEQLSLLLDALLLGDGSHRVPDSRCNYSGKTATYFTTSNVLADQVQTLALLCGRSSRRGKRMKSGVYPVTVTTASTRFAILPKHLSREHYEGTVWCVTVPNGLIITRRNGKTLVSGNSSSVADQHLCDNVLNPRISLISEVLTRFINQADYLGITGGDKYLVYLEQATSKDVDYELQRDVAMLGQAAMSRNEFRSRHNMARIKDGDNVVIGGVVIPIVSEEHKEAEKESSPHSPASMINTQKRRGRDKFKTLAESLGQEDTALIILRHADEIKKEFAPDLAEFFQDMGREWRATLEPHFNGHAVANTVYDEIDVDHWTNKLRERCRPHLEKHSTTGASLAWEMYTPRKSFQVNEKGFLENFSRLPGRVFNAAKKTVSNILSLGYWNNIIGGVRDHIAADAADTSHTKSDLADIIDKRLGEDASAKKAENVASVEGMGATNGGHHDGMDDMHESGDLHTKTWKTMEDDLVRRSHAQLQDATVAIDEDFMVGGFPAKYPCDPALPIAQRANCRCVAVGGNDEWI